MNKFERINCRHFIEIKGYAYLSNLFFNGLFQVELETGKTTFLGYFENENYDECNIHKESLQQGELLYFFPRRGRHVHVFSLIDQSISAIEVRKVSEKFFRIDEVILDGTNVIFLPLEKNAPIKKLDLNTKIVKEIEKTDEVSKGIYLSQIRTSIPMPLLDKYQIERSVSFSWKRMPDGRWCTFMPTGQHLLWYTPKTEKFESISLIITNKEELDAFVRSSMPQSKLKQYWFKESKSLNLQAYKYAVMWQSTNEQKNTQAAFVGDNIWGHVKI